MATHEIEHGILGALLVVVGPSGSGKDTLLNWLRPHFSDNPNVMFARRTVTRELSQGHEENENHNVMTVNQFVEAEHAGEFCVVWQAHGLHYGVSSVVQSHTASGGVAILNGSRCALPALQEVFPHMHVAHITANREVLRDRLLMRERESAIDIEKRLDRMSIGIDPVFNAFEIDNSGPIEQAGNRLLERATKLTMPHLTFEVS